MSDIVYSNLDKDSIDILSELEKGGNLTPANVVEAAQRPGSPLHRHFTWDDKDAAAAHRLAEARALIRRVKVVMIDKPAPPIRAFVNIQDSDAKHRYASVFTVLEDEELRDQHRARLFQKMKRLHVELIEFDEFSVVAGAIEDVIKAA